MRIAVYTAIFDKKDLLKEPEDYTYNQDVDYFVVTENIFLESKIYKKILAQIRFTDITKNARYYKIMGHNMLLEYDIIIWHDGSLRMKDKKVYELASFLNDSEIATFQHPDRKNFYEEAIACIRLNKDFPLRIYFQSLIYFFKGIPPESGLFETSILVKKKTSSNTSFLKAWWGQIQDYSRRDQLALSYIAWRKEKSIEIIPGNRNDNIYSEFYPHSYSNYKSKNPLGLKILNNSLIKRIVISSLKFIKGIN